MANKRDQSRQRRARENRAQRAALEARTKGQPPKRPSRVAPSTAEKLERTAKERPATPAGSGASDTRNGGTDASPTPKRSGGLFGGGRPRPVRPGDVPVDVDELQGSWFSRVNQVPGGRFVLMGALMTLVVSGMISFVDSFVAAGDRGDPDAQPTETLFEAVDNVGAAMVVLGVPILAAGASLYFAMHPQRRRVWTFSAVAVAVILVQILYIPYLFVIGFLFFAIRKSSKVEGPRSRQNTREGDDLAEDDEPDLDDDDHDDDDDLGDDGLEPSADDEAGATVVDAPDAGDGPISTKGWLPGRRRSGA